MLSSSTHVYSEIYLHINWHTDNNKPAITSSLEPELYAFIENYCRKSKGANFVAVNGTEDHIHLVLQIEPQLNTSDLVGKVKGASSHEMNRRFGPGTLEWQRGFAVVSFAKRNLQAVVNYVANQKEHHKKQDLNGTLERLGGEEGDRGVTTDKG